jgi:ABC-type transporter Mla subunit MlaD
MKRVVTILAVAGACAAAFVLAGASNDSGQAQRYRIVFDNAFGLVEGGDFRVGGVKAGKTTGFDVVKRPGHAPKAVVEAEITEPGFGDFRRDASCEIKPQSLIGEYYVDCQPGSAKERLPENGVVPVEQTASTIPADLVNDILRRPYRERFRLILTELGTGLAGRPEDLQAVLRRAHPGLRETSRVLRILGDQNRVIERFITNADTVISQLEHNKRDVVRWIDEAGDTAAISATRRRQLREGFHKLPRFLDELRPTMQRLGDVADEQTPLLTDLQHAAPDLDTFFTKLGPFSDASRPAVRTLGEASEVGDRAVREGRQEIAELRALAKGAPALARPLRQFLGTLDDRRRAIENDPRASATAPPAPDPTAIKGEGGFTGLEAIWNYVYWQTLSVNMVGNVGGTTAHILRAALTLNDCSFFQNEPPKAGTAKDAAFFKKCGAYLGPSQPGLKGLGPGWETADPLDDGDPASRVRANAGKPATRVGERRGPGQPEAGPLPGQRDLSKPQVVLPPQLQELLDSLTPKQQLELPRAPDKLQDELQDLGETVNDETTGELLDYLLTP